MTAFSERLRELRESLNLSQNEFSKRLGVSRVSLTHYEAGDRTPDIDFLSRLHQDTGVSIYYLLGLTDSKDDALATTQKDTGLSEKALTHFANNPISAKVINHIVECGAMKSFADRAAILHDDALLAYEFQQNEWTEIAKTLRNAQFQHTDKEMQSLISAVLIDTAYRTPPFGVDRDLLPSLSVCDLVDKIKAVFDSLDVLSPNYPEAASVKKEYGYLLDKLITGRENPHAKKTPES